jgi:hypothetical protein
MSSVMGTYLLYFTTTVIVHTKPTATEWFYFFNNWIFLPSTFAKFLGTILNCETALGSGLSDLNGEEYSVDCPYTAEKVKRYIGHILSDIQSSISI